MRNAPRRTKVANKARFIGRRFTQPMINRRGLDLSRKRSRRKQQQR
jgi:hypothetical protein